MKRNELERAWPAAEPTPGFSERVLQRLQQGPALPAPTLPRANPLGRLPARRLRWLLLPIAALALGGILLLRPIGPAQRGDVIAAEPRSVAIGERAVAEMSSGAHLRWSSEGPRQQVQQDRGAVTYRVLPGGPFRVQTPHGNVSVLGTEFRVVIADSAQAQGDPMKKRWAVAAAGATLGALLWVSVDRGLVQLSNQDRELVLQAGQAGAIGSDGIPRLQAVPSAPADAQQANRDAERARNRQLADTVRRHAAQRRAAALTAKPTTASPPTSGQNKTPPVEFVLPKDEQTFGPYPAGTPEPPAEPEAAQRRDYIKRTVREQYFPIARDCYQELLERQPTAEGKIVLEFAIVGDGDAGVVDRVAIREDQDTIADPEFQLCMQESMYTAVFEPPPPGTEETTVVYPIMLKPN
jgi:ferric-dicitrate binding protein FerR (iron transport regulator)